MNDQQIVTLFWERDDGAIAATAACYGRYCRRVALNILGDELDADECINEAYFQLWNAIPPERPESIGAYVAKITRRIALNRWRDSHAQKRGKGEIPLLLSELEHCVPSCQSVEQQLTAEELGRYISSFVRSLPDHQRIPFVQRYWYGEALKTVAVRQGISESRMKSQLFRTRQKLREFLEQGGFEI